MKWSRFWNPGKEDLKGRGKLIPECYDTGGGDPAADENLHWWRSMISHNFRMPMSIIDGYARLLKEGDITEKGVRQDCIDKICDNIEYLITLTALMLDDKEMQQSAEKECKGANLLATIRLVSGCVANMAKKNATEIRLMTTVEEVGLAIDKISLMHVFYNLIENSFKYMGRSGLIQITVGAFEKNEILVVYKDTGVGMAKEEADHIFEQHYQGSNRTWGAGMGMYFVSEIMKKANASIYAVSDIDKGMGVYMRFPIVR